MGKTSRLVVGGLLGMAAGAARGYVDAALEEQRARNQAMRDEQLARIARETHVANRQSDIDFANQEREARTKRVGEFFAANEPITQSVPEEGMLPKESKREAAERQHAAALKTGDKDIIAQTEASLKTARDDEKGQRDERRLDLMQAFQEKQLERQNTLAQATLEHQKRMAEIASTQAASADKRAEQAVAQAQRQATAAALKGVSDDIKALEKESADPMLDPAKKKVIERQIANLRTEGEGYRKALAAGGLPTPEAPAPSAAPSGNDPLGLRKPASTPAPAARNSAPGADPVPKGGMLATADPIQKATDAQLWAAVSGNDAMQKQFAIAELKRRGLLKDEETVGGGGRMNFGPA